MRPMHPVLAFAVLALLAMPSLVEAGSVSCEMRFNLSGWSAFYKRSSGQGTITCSNGQSMRVALEARGGGLSVGRSSIEDGIGKFSAVNDIRDLVGGYATAEAHAGAGRSAKGQVVTKGSISLALSGTGRGWDVGIAFGSFTIRER